MRPTAEELAFWDALRDGDDTGKLALADWLTEHGNPVLAHALKWCVKRNHWPRVTPKERYAIWDRRSTRDKKPFPHKLPWQVFDTMRAPQGQLRFTSVRAAVLALAHHLDQLAIMCAVPGEGRAA